MDPTRIVLYTRMNLKEKVKVLLIMKLLGVRVKVEMGSGGAAGVAITGQGSAKPVLRQCGSSSYRSTLDIDPYHTTSRI